MAASSSFSPRSQNIHPTLTKTAPFIFDPNREWPEELNTALSTISDVLFSVDESSIDKNQIGQLKPALEIIKRYIRTCSAILYEPDEVSLKSEIYLNILSILNCHFQQAKKALKAQRKAFCKALQSKEQELAKKEEKEENIRPEKQRLEAWKKSSIAELTTKEQELITEKKAFIEAFLQDLIELQKHTAELKRRWLLDLSLSILQNSVPLIIQDSTIFVPPPDKPWLVSDPNKLSDRLGFWSAVEIIATVKSRLEANELYDNYVSELNIAITFIEKYRRSRENREDLKEQIPVCEGIENYGKRLRSELFKLREITLEVPNPRRSGVASNASERGPSFFESKQEVEINEKSDRGKAEIDTPISEKPLANADLTFRLLREHNRKKESRIGKFIRKHPVKAAAIIIFGCLTILCVGAGIGLLSSGIGLGIAAGIVAAGISLLSVGPVYPVVLGGAYCLYKAYYNQFKKQYPDDDREYFKPLPP